jgi:hypothetical protein
MAPRRQRRGFFLADARVPIAPEGIQVRRASREPPSDEFHFNNFQPARHNVASPTL